MERAREQSSGFKMYLLAAYYLAAGNISLTTIAMGVVVVILGATVVSQVHDVFAGMFGIWGASMVLFGAIAYAALWANRLIARYTE